MTVNAFYRYGQIYRQALSTPLMNWCDLMKATSSSNKIIKSFLEIARDIEPSAVHKCPYEVITKIKSKNFYLLKILFFLANCRFQQNCSSWKNSLLLCLRRVQRCFQPYHNRQSNNRRNHNFSHILN